MQQDEMLKLYVEKRIEYETKIKENLEKIEDSVKDLAQVGDYFSVKNDDLLITIKAIEVDGDKHIAIFTDKNSREIPFGSLTLTEHPDLILWIIQNDLLIREGFKEVLINAVRNGENIINTLKALKVNYE
ncbi:MAG: hypothetical protein IJI98_09440 [Methanosphaera sp.]|uniref:hypothetical protein n=1 Tax=Methanosphaera sp. ISO3-F5 TaxID=1452353 RepID=UPI002B260F13|nr:hypothetical protein [Methanosphaera sp. ISO3-F5]MBR0472903.1 hypothetical protein [Methanosphaera sp.]WQH64534.1 hypothetical protein PXD04_01700 [Methanosphaera sp. ISO3-F5]